MSIPVPKLEIAFSGTLETVSVASYVLEMRLSFGRHRYLESIPVGTATIRLLNSDNRFHPLNTSGPYWNTGTGFDAGHAISVTAYSGTVPGLGGGFYTRIWEGYVTNWSVDLSTSPTSNIAILMAEDLVGRFRRKIVPAGTLAATHYTVRMTDLLSVLGGLSYGVGDEDAMYWRWMSLWGVSYTQQSLMSLIEATDTSAMATTWMLQTGSYAALALPPGGVNTVTDGLHFVPYARTAIGEIPYVRISPLGQSPFLYNQVTLSQSSGTPITVEDATSIARYGLQPFVRTGVTLISDADITAHANRFLAVHKTPVFCPSWVEVDMAAFDTTYQAVAFLELTMGYPWGGVGESYFIQGGHNQPGGACRVTAGAYTFECVIEGVDHIITSTKSWVVRYYLSPRIFYTDPL